MIQFDKKLYQAINTAAIYHNGQARKANKMLPYISHPLAVAMILQEFTQDQDIIITAILHDTIEDTKYTIDQLEQDFGPTIKKMVLELTEGTFDELKNTSWEQRKENYLSNIKKASKKSLIVCAADKIHNMLSRIYLYEEMGDQMWQYFSGNIERTMWFNNEVLQILKDKIEHPLVDELEKLNTKAKKLFIKKT